MTDKTLCITVTVEHQYPVTVVQDISDAALFTVTYGKQIKDRLRYAEAAKEFGECVFHALACNGQLNNDGD